MRSSSGHVSCLALWSICTPTPEVVSQAGPITAKRATLTQSTLTIAQTTTRRSRTVEMCGEAAPEVARRARGVEDACPVCWVMAGEPPSTEACSGELTCALPNLRGVVPVRGTSVPHAGNQS